MEEENRYPNESGEPEAAVRPEEEEASASVGEAPGRTEDTRILPLNYQGYKEETASEIAVPYRGGQHVPVRNEGEESVSGAAGGKTAGIFALVFSILSLFAFPIFFGIAGIIIGFAARKKGAVSLGSWAIGISVLSILTVVFLMPFF